MSLRSSIYVREDIDPTIADEALSLVNHDNIRTLSDHPSDYHTRIAEVWSALFAWHVKPEDISIALIALKLVAETNEHTRDNIVGIVQYALCLDAVARTEKNIETLWNESKVTTAPTVTKDARMRSEHAINTHHRA
jgi:hypothetical protein